jgi:hypothetical protein
VRLGDEERKRLAEIDQKLGKQVLAEVAMIVKPDTILAWHRKLVAQKFNGSQQRKAPAAEPESECLCGALGALGSRGCLSGLILCGECSFRHTLQG